MDLRVPKVMGILNVTPDSFFQGSRCESEAAIRRRVIDMISAGADIIDIGGCSTRPGFEAPSAVEEWERVDKGCGLVKEVNPDLPISIDTFRASVAKKAIEKWKVDIINDISGGSDPEMWHLVADSRIVYVLTHNREKEPCKYDDVTAEVITELSRKLNELHGLGVNDIIIDPGFGFAKTIDQNFQLFEELEEISATGLPLLVGISRKSMIYNALGIEPADSLAGTVALDAIALEKGADILRVHDVAEAVQTVKLFTRLKYSKL